MIFNYGPGDNATIWLLLRRTLVLQQVYWE